MIYAFYTPKLKELGKDKIKTMLQLHNYTETTQLDSICATSSLG